MVRRENPDLIVCDVQLPDIDGFGLPVGSRAIRCCGDSRCGRYRLGDGGDRDRVLAAGSMATWRNRSAGNLRSADGGFSSAEKHLRHFSHYHCGYLPEPAANTPGPTILAVDNLPLNIELARCILEPSGYRVVYCHQHGRWPGEWPARPCAT